MGLTAPSCSFLVSVTLSELSSLGSDLELLVSCVEGGLEDLLWFLLLPLQGEEVQEGGVTWVEQCALMHHPGLDLGCSASKNQNKSHHAAPIDAQYNPFGIS